MEQQFKPEGYNSVSPYFIVEDSKKWLELLQKIFDGEEVRRYENPDGSLMHGEIWIDDSILMYSEATEEYPANQFLMHVYVPDAIEVYNKALNYGCEGMQEPIQKKDDPDLRGQFRDFAGNVWAVGSQGGS